MQKLKTGAASIRIEMPIGADMTGYIGRMGRASGIHDDLMVKTVAFYDGIKTFVLVVCDLLGFDNDFTDQTIRLIHDETGIDKENIVIACTHTHSGPASIKLLNCGNVDANWLDKMKQVIIKSVKDAENDLKDSVIELSFADCAIGYNRVLKGSVKEKQMIDDKIGILSIKTGDGSIPGTLLINYACHPVVLDEENTLYSRDYPYFIQSEIKAKTGLPVEVIYTSGCCGDIDPILRGGFDNSKACGSLLADEIIKKISTSSKKKINDEASIAIDSYDVRMPVIHDLTQEKLLTIKKEIERKSRIDDPYIKRKVTDAYIMWADEMLAHIKNKTLLSYIDAGIKVISIGKLKIVTLPFEAFHEIGKMIKKHFGENNTFVICYANGDFGYMASKSLYEQAEYEIRDAYKFYCYPGPLAKEAQDILMNTF